MSFTRPNIVRFQRTAALVENTICTMVCTLNWIEGRQSSHQLSSKLQMLPGTFLLKQRTVYKIWNTHLRNKLGVCWILDPDPRSDPAGGWNKKLKETQIESITIKIEKRLIFRKKNFN